MKYGKKLINSIIEFANNQVYPYKVWGIFGTIAYPFYYFVWLFANPQGYENFWLRMIATILCFILIFHNKWPKNFRKYLPIYWYITILYCLPFFFSVMLLKNHFSFASSLNILAALVLYILLLDTLSFYILLIAGVTLGVLFFKITGEVFYLEEQYIYILISYLSVLFIGNIFVHNKELIQKEKLQTMKTIGTTIAHELRTPLATIDTSAEIVKEALPTLVNAYNIVDKKQLESELIGPRQFEALKRVPDIIQSEGKYAFLFIDMILMSTKEISLIREGEKFSVLNCIKKAVLRYPFKEHQQNLVNIKNDSKDFMLKGSEVLFIHVIFNLLKNSLYYIAAAGKGEINIWIENKKRYHFLFFQDTGAGIAKNVLVKVFDYFFSNTHHGFGIGLAFSKRVVEAHQGYMSCESIENEYTKFIMRFPANRF